ncbi:hypothetical protein GN956_G25685 [Arapaima gigas]
MLLYLQRRRWHCGCHSEQQTHSLKPRQGGCFHFPRVWTRRPVQETKLLCERLQQLRDGGERASAVAVLLSRGTGKSADR